MANGRGGENQGRLGVNQESNDAADSKRRPVEGDSCESASRSRRKAAIAYVSRDLLGLSRGDVLVLNASRAAVSAGQTSATLLRAMSRRGVRLYDCIDLHA